MTGPTLPVGHEEELRVLEELGVVPPPGPVRGLDALREVAAAVPVVRWEFRRRVRVAVLDPTLAGDVVRPRVQALAFPPPRDDRERRWGASFLAEAARGGGLRAARVIDAARAASNGPHLAEAFRALEDRFLARYAPGLVRPLARDLETHALRIALLWTEGEAPDEALALLAAAVSGDGRAAGAYRERLRARHAAGRAGGLLAGLDGRGPDDVGDAALFAELVALTGTRIFAAVGRRVHRGEREEAGPAPALVERAVLDDPPWAVHVRETIHEFRLGTHRLPPRSRLFVPVLRLGRQGESAADTLRLSLALGIPLCPPLGDLLDLARSLVRRLDGRGRLDPAPDLVFAEGDGPPVPDALGVHVRPRPAGSV